MADRQNRQGDASAEDLPDITGKLEDTACTLGDVGEDITLVGTVCNSHDGRQRRRHGRDADVVVVEECLPLG